jgi:acid phosphatase type 7
VLFPTPGNHDYYSATQSSRSHTYYNIFTMPTAGESGGIASGTEAWYSYDWGNIHFLSLDSYGTESPNNSRLYDTTGPQVNWIKNDLAANNKKWTVAYWHHPPYTMGSHNSDTESELVNIRQNFIRILERYGVDLILCGHSHDYERPYPHSLHRLFFRCLPGLAAIAAPMFAA